MTLLLPQPPSLLSAAISESLLLAFPSAETSVLKNIGVVKYGPTLAVVTTGASIGTVTGASTTVCGESTATTPASRGCFLRASSADSPVEEAHEAHTMA